MSNIKGLSGSVDLLAGGLVTHGQWYSASVELNAEGMRQLAEWATDEAERMEMVERWSHVSSDTRAVLKALRDLSPVDGVETSGTNRIKAIKLFREMNPGVGLREAKEFIDSL